MKAINLRCEYTENPLGIDDEQGRYILDRTWNTIFKAGVNGQPNKWVTFYAYLAGKFSERI